MRDNVRKRQVEPRALQAVRGGDRAPAELAGAPHGREARVARGTGTRRDIRHGRMARVCRRAQRRRSPPWCESPPPGACPGAGDGAVTVSGGRGPESARAGAGPCAGPRGPGDATWPRRTGQGERTRDGAAGPNLLHGGRRP